MTAGGEDVARRLASRGREKLLERLRPAFAEAAAAHRDVLQLDDDRLEEIVHRAVERADGLQWRRALAMAAVEELEIPLSEALSHPEVVRAQEIAGAPSYEEALARITGPRAPTNNGSRSEGETEAPAAGAGALAQDGPSAEVQDSPFEVAHDHSSGVAQDSPFEVANDGSSGVAQDGPPGAAAAQAETVEVPDGGESEAEVVETGSSENDGILTEPPEREVALRAVHIRGIESLDGDRGPLRIVITASGIQIVRESSPDPLFMLRWREVRTFALTKPRGPRRRRQAARLRIGTVRAEAFFDLPGTTPEEFRRRVDPLHPVG